jgi:hypothetical protein
MQQCVVENAFAAHDVVEQTMPTPRGEFERKFDIVPQNLKRLFVRPELPHLKSGVADIGEKNCADISACSAGLARQGGAKYMRFY